MPSVSIVATDSGITEIVPAPTTGSIVVYGFQCESAMPSNRVEIRSGDSTVLATPFLNFGGTIVCPVVERASEPYFRCAAGQALNLNLSNSGWVSITCQYAVE